MDADVALRDFADVPFVVERPATPDLLANAAVAALSRAGLRMVDEGALARERLVVAGLSPRTGYISRATGIVSSSEAPLVLAGHSDSGTSREETVAAAFRSWRMLGRALDPRSPDGNAVFASFMGLRAGLGSSDLRACASRIGTTAGRPGTSPELARDLIEVVVGHRTEIMGRVDLGALDEGRIASLAGKATARFLGEVMRLHDRREHRDQDLAVLQDGAEDDDRFKAHDYVGPVVGPSYLPPGRFNLKTLRTAQWVHDDLLRVVARARQISAVRFEIVPGTGGHRSAATQARLKRAGKSRAKLGRHTIGHAVDLVPVDAEGLYDFGDHEGFAAIRDAMRTAAEELGIPIQWGGNWKKLVDKPHFELDRRVYPGPGEKADVEGLAVAFR